MQAAHSRPIGRASGVSCISRPGAGCGTVDSSIPAPVRARTWHPPRERRMKATTNRCIRDAAARRWPRREPIPRLPGSTGGFACPMGKRSPSRICARGRSSIVAGRDFGDFVVWRRDDVPAYQLAVVADDAAMQITEVVRGMDLLKSTARQLLLIQALATGRSAVLSLRSGSRCQWYQAGQAA